MTVREIRHRVITNYKRKMKNGGGRRAPLSPSFSIVHCPFALRRSGRTPGQILEEYVLILGLVGVPFLLALPKVVGAMREWTVRLLAWWSLPIP